MNLSQWLVLDPRTMLFLCNVAAVVLIVSIVGLIAAFVWRRSPAPVSHGILFSTLLLLLAAPVLVCVAEVVGVGGIPIETTPSLATDSGGESSHPDDRGTGIKEEPQSRGVDSPGIVSPPVRPLTVHPSVEAPHAGQVTTRNATNTSWWLIAGHLLVTLWAIGSVVSLLLLARGFIRLIRFRRGLTKRASAGIVRAAARLASQVGLSKPPRILLSVKSVSPMTMGLVSPVIVLPKHLKSEVNPQQLDDVLLHEMAHIARHDHWVGLGQRLALVLYWWCPLVFAVNRQLRRLREDICDNYVLRRTDDGSRFAELLVTLAERATFQPRLPAVTELFHAREHELERRVNRLLSTETNTMVRTNVLARLLLVAFAVSLGATVPLLAVRAEDQEAASSPVDKQSPAKGNLRTVAAAGKRHTLPADPKAVVLSLDYRGGDGPPRKRRSDEPYLKVLADGTAVAGAPFGRMKRLTTKLTARQVQDLLQFVLDEQHFRTIQSKDLAPPKGTFTVIAGGQKATIQVNCDAKPHQVAFTPGANLMARAAGKGKASPAARILAIRQRLERVRAEMHAGGKKGIAAHLRAANARLKVAHPDVPPLDADNLQSAMTTAAGTRYVSFERKEKLKGGKTRLTLARLQYRPGAEPTVNVSVYMLVQTQLHRPSGKPVINRGSS